MSDPDIFMNMRETILSDTLIYYMSSVRTTLNLTKKIQTVRDFFNLLNTDVLWLTSDCFIEFKELVPQKCEYFTDRVNFYYKNRQITKSLRKKTIKALNKTIRIYCNQHNRSDNSDGTHYCSRDNMCDYHRNRKKAIHAVSYTHLPLPTKA